MEMFQPPETIVIEKPKPRGVGPISQRVRRIPTTILGKVDRFKHVRNHKYKIKHFDDHPGAANPSHVPFDAEFSVASHKQSSQVLNTLKRGASRTCAARRSSGTGLLVVVVLAFLRFVDEPIIVEAARLRVG